MLPTSACKFLKNKIPFLSVQVFIVPSMTSMECCCSFLVEKELIDRFIISYELNGIRYAFAFTHYRPLSHEKFPHAGWDIARDSDSINPGLTTIFFDMFRGLAKESDVCSKITQGWHGDK